MKRLKTILAATLSIAMLAGLLAVYTPAGTDAAAAVKIKKTGQTVKIEKGKRVSVKLAGKALKKLKNKKKKLSFKCTGTNVVMINQSKGQKKKYTFSIKALNSGISTVTIKYKKAKIKIKVKVSDGSATSDTSTGKPTDKSTSSPSGSTADGTKPTTIPAGNDPSKTEVPAPTEVPLRTEITVPESQPETVDGKEKITDLTTYSRDGKNLFNLWTNNDGRLYYNVVCDGKTIIDISSMGLVLSDTDLSRGLSYEKGSSKVYEMFEEYETMTLSAATATNHCQERVVKFTNVDGASFELVIRVYDDGVAYRYTNVTDGDLTMVTCTSELSNVMLPENTKTVWGGWGGINTYEHDYTETAFSSFVNRNGRYDTPFLVNVDDYWMLVSEAQIYNNHRDFCKSQLKTSSGSRSLEYDFGDGRDETVPIEEQARRNNTNNDLVNIAQKTITQVDAFNGFSTPWRAMVISNDFNKFCTSTLISNLNPPPEESEFADVYEDISWLKPGKVLWSWWAYGNDQGNYNKHRDYIDMAAEYGFDYVCLDVGWRSFENRLKELCDYAAAKDVGVFCWVNYWELTTEEDIENLFSKWNEAGCIGLKTDYFEGEDQKVLEVMENIAVIAAKYHMMVLYHGCPTPGGEYRTYPNIMTTEAVLGEENRKWSNSPSSKNCLMYPFTRNILGSMDYTPACKEIRNMIGETESFALAKTVVYESSLQHFAAAADEYKNYKGLKFMQDLSTTWDESFVPQGEASPGHYVTFVRRNGEKWYLGSMTAEARTTDFDLNFLEEGETYIAHINESDGSGKLSLRDEEVTSADRLTFSFKNQDGVAIYFEKE